MNEIKKTYWGNGTIKSEASYSNKKKQGILKIYNNNGILVQSVDYCDDKINGKVKSFFEDGSIESQETYIDGKRQNDLIVYNRYGSIIYSKDFERINDDNICTLERSFHHHF
jgi:antitoxin component YwqK of YwqJK toxin-antitoxin module